MKYFAFTYTYGPDTELVDATRPAHREFISSQLSLGRIVGSGPYAGGKQALIILQLPDTATVADAETIMDEDPYTVKSALAEREVHEWNPVSNIFSGD
ncbi:YciI family protein [Corynebacterium sp. p3-SID1056]|uniref:YciI family protein n=1 Tax=Corynebacterium sp. p3-SID1056 TaxID=2916092 RepID=UPI0021A6D658|nr:YciI family protein [Corynebacterium sp. p3-SID1056]MCT2337782.1 YciI family protein [Corynebacterium sp. p3-SID1056]